jgi:hypothetical protein
VAHGRRADAAVLPATRASDECYADIMSGPNSARLAHQQRE